MKRSTKLARRHSIAISFCLMLFVALIGSVLSVPSGRADGQARRGAEPSAPAVTQLCFTNQSLMTPDPAPGSRGGGIPTDSTGCNIAGMNCMAQGGTGFFYDLYAINVTGCGMGQNPSITARTCNAVCGQAAGTADTLIFIYQKTNGDPGSTGSPVFDPLAPCTNFRASDNNGCNPQSTQTVTLCPGIFVVVVTHNLQHSQCPTPSTNCGTYNLEILVNSGTTCQINQAPTAVEVDALEANGYVDGTNINWKTGREVDNLGFNIYREDNGKRSRVNPQLVAGSALLAGPGVDLASGNSYSWTDNLPAGKDTRYWLEDIALDGRSTWHGPMAVDLASGSARPSSPKGGRMPDVLSKLGRGGSPATGSTPLPRRAKPTQTAAAELVSQAGAVKRPAIKIGVNREGWYHVSRSELVAAGLNPNTDPRNLQLFAGGIEQRLRVVGEEAGRFDAIEFYGLGLDSSASDIRTYWLVSGSGPGQRIGRSKGKGKSDAPISFPYTVERRDRSIYFSALRNGETENFFGAVVSIEPINQTLGVRHMDRVSNAEATLELSLRGVTLLPHRVQIDLNGTAVGEASFEGQAGWLETINVQRGILREGENVVTLTPLGGEGDVSLVDYIRITYPRFYTAEANSLRFSAPSKRRVTINGFTSSSIRVIDVTDPDAVSEVPANVSASGVGYSAAIKTAKGAGTRLLWAFAGDTALAPVEIRADQPSNLRDPATAADLVIISHRDFLESARALKTLREGQGLRVSVVDVEDIYDEFNFGDKSPRAIRDFLVFTRSNWDVAPRFAVLIGDASLDPKDYLGFGDSDFVPTRLIDTGLMETASDDWLADFDEDGLADISLGRLPVRSAGEAASVVNKIIGYEGASPSNGVLLVSDINEEYNFESMSNHVREAVPAGTTVSELARGRIDPAAAETELRARLEQGQRVVNYIGHGSVSQWRGNLLTSALARGLTNTQLPLFVSMTCLNGYFQDAASESLGESLLKAERGGAIAVWTSSGITGPIGQSSLNQEMFRIIFDGGETPTLGEATLKAKALVNDLDIRRTWILLGDPTMKLR